MFVNVQGYRVDDRERKPAVLTFVIDVSGSMSMENRLELVKCADLTPAQKTAHGCDNGQFKIVGGM